MDTLQGLILERARNEANEAAVSACVAGYNLLPHVKYSPRLYHDGLQWVCVWGLETPIVGRGGSPREALYNFDKLWNGDSE